MATPAELAVVGRQTYMNFGKHRGRTYMDVYKNHRDYLRKKQGACLCPQCLSATVAVVPLREQSNFPLSAARWHWVWRVWPRRCGVRAPVLLRAFVAIASRSAAATDAAMSGDGMKRGAASRGVFVSL